MNSMTGVRVVGVSDLGVEEREDSVAVEEPLEIRLGFFSEGRRVTRSLSITMRTPGHDFDLVAGFLVGEGIVARRGDIEKIQQAGAPGSNVVRVDLERNVEFSHEQLNRNFYMTSSCGVCGKASLEAIAARGCGSLARGGFTVPAGVIHGLPGKLRQEQAVFERTGGLHAACLFDGEGAILTLREDVGRHNAVDKVVGARFFGGKIPVGTGVLLVSGRASFELVQKAAMAGIPVLAAVGAPSSLAVELAMEMDMTLLGFVRDERFNIYSGEWRIVHETKASE